MLQMQLVSNRILEIFLAVINHASRAVYQDSNTNNTRKTPVDLGTARTQRCSALRKFRMTRRSTRASSVPNSLRWYSICALMFRPDTRNWEHDLVLGPSFSSIADHIHSPSRSQSSVACNVVTSTGCIQLTSCSTFIRFVQLQLLLRRCLNGMHRQLGLT